MANYANAKSIIAANIYTNHEGQVTAEMVKTAANSIVNTLIAGGYLYAGIAHPGDAAVSPDANVFYIATEPGTYTNKGGLVVADGEVAIFKWNGTWSKEVTGAATAAQVTELDRKVGGYSLSEITYNILDGVFSNAGSIVSGTRFYHTSPIEVKAGECLVIKGTVQINSSVASLAIVDGEGTFIMPVYCHPTGNELFSYRFVPIADCHVSVSYYQPVGDTVYIEKYSDSYLYEEKLAEIKSWVLNETYTVRAGTVVRDSDGNVSSAFVFFPDGTIGSLTVTRDSNYNATSVVVNYCTTNVTITINRDSNGYVISSSITI